MVRELKSHQISAVFHYIPLHLAPQGILRGRHNHPLPVTEHIADCIIRLPLFADLQNEELWRILAAVEEFSP